MYFARGLLGEDLVLGQCKYAHLHLELAVQLAAASS